MPPSYVWVALVILLAAVALAVVGLMVVAGYFVYQLGREKQLEARAQWDQPLPTSAEDEADRKMDEQEEARLGALLDQAKDQNRMVKDDWREEKLNDGWSEEDIEDFLENRPLLELN